MKHAGDVVEILEAFDLTGSLRDAARLAGADEAEALYRLVDAAYEKRSLILTSNLHPARFDTIFPKGLATAAVDRLLHHAHVIVTEGQSHRLMEAIDGQGVKPAHAQDPDVSDADQRVEPDGRFPMSVVG